MKDYRMPLVISFVLKLKGDERIDGDGLQYGHVFLLSSVWKGSMEENGAVREENWMSVGNDGMGRMISLYSIHSYLFSLGRWRANEVSDCTCFLVLP